MLGLGNDVCQQCDAPVNDVCQQCDAPVNDVCQQCDASVNDVCQQCDAPVPRWLKKGLIPVDVFSTGWHPSTKSLYQLPHTPHGMYFPSTPLPSSPFLLQSEKDMVGVC